MTEAWDVQFAPSALRGLDRLPPRIAPAIIEFATRTLPRNPQQLSKPLRGELEGLCSARRGDYRVIYEIDEGAHRVVIHVIEHRADAYRRR